MEDKITDLVRPTLNNIIRSVVTTAMEDLKQETKNIQYDIDCERLRLPQMTIEPNDISKSVMSAGSMAVAGGILLGPVGAILGGLAGFAIGLFANKAEKAAKEAEFKSDVRGAINTAIVNITNSSKVQLENIFKNIKLIVENIQDKAKEETEESIKLIKEDIEKNEVEYNKLKTERIEIVEDVKKLQI